MSKTKEDKRREQKRMAMRKAREKLKNNPSALEAARAKDRIRKKATRKKIGELSERDQRSTRKEWRKRSQKCRDKKKMLVKDVNDVLSPPPSPEQHEEQNPIPLQAIQMNASSSQKKTGENIRRKNRKSLQEEVRRLKQKVTQLEKSKEKYKKRLQRKRKSEAPEKDTPTRKVDELLGFTPVTKKVRRALEFAEVIQSQLKQNFRKKTHSVKKTITQILSGKLVAKYRMKTKLQHVTSRKTWNYNKKCELIQKSDTVKKLIHEFFESDENSRMCPGKKECITKKKVKKQKRLLSDSLQNLHEKFTALLRQTLDPNFTISYATFCKCRPFWVVKPDYRDRETCMCQVHANFELMVTKAHSLKLIKENNVTSVIKTVTCCNDGKFENICLARKCPGCQNKGLPWSPVTNNDNNGYPKSLKYPGRRKMEKRTLGNA